MKVLSFLFFYALNSLTGVLCLQCYTCVSVDCGGNQDWDLIETHILSWAKSFYYPLQNTIPSCPEPYAVEASWRLIANKCREQRKGDATCALGRIKVDVREKSNGKEVSIYGSITGCARVELLKKTSAKRGSCDMSVKKFEDSKQAINVTFEHCNRIENICHRSDKCISPKMIEVKRWGDAVNDQYYSKHFYFIGGIILIAVLYLGLVVCGLLMRR